TSWKLGESLVCRGEYRVWTWAHQGFGQTGCLDGCNEGCECTGRLGYSNDVVSWCWLFDDRLVLDGSFSLWGACERTKHENCGHYKRGKFANGINCDSFHLRVLLLFLSFTTVV